MRTAGPAQGHWAPARARKHSALWLAREKRQEEPMAMVLDPCATLERKVRLRVRDDESHRRVAAALTEVAVAAIHPARHVGLGLTASEGMLEAPIENATQAAVETLIASLEDLMASLPRPTVDRLANEQLAAELGIE
jgi:hypothetical protein